MSDKKILISSDEKLKYDTKLMFEIADDVDADEGECCQEINMIEPKSLYSMYYVA